MKRFLSVLAMAVLVLQSMVTSLVYATDQANPNEEPDSVPVAEAVVVDEVLSGEYKFTYGEIEAVLKNLLSEMVSISDMVTILETLADFGRITKRSRT